MIDRTHYTYAQSAHACTHTHRHWHTKKHTHHQHQHQHHQHRVGVSNNYMFSFVTIFFDSVCFVVCCGRRCLLFRYYTHLQVLILRPLGGSWKPVHLQIDQSSLLSSPLSSVMVSCTSARFARCLWCRNHGDTAAASPVVIDVVITVIQLEFRPLSWMS